MSDNMRQVRIGVIGCGHWGPNHIRVFSELADCEVVACADLSTDRLGKMKQRFPQIETTTDHHDILDNDNIDAVIICTPTATHAAIAKECLQSGKHVLVEKPICTNPANALELGRLAESKNLILMVGHIFVFNNGVRKLRELIASDHLGRVHYLDAVRTNLGPIRGDVNALYDLATHDISIFNYLLDATPVRVSATGRCYTQRNIEDVCFATLEYPDGTLGHIHVSWLNPRKVRTLTVIGDRKMGHWDDVNPFDTLRIYDKGVAEEPYYDSYGEFQYLLRSGDVHMPSFHRTEPLVNQAVAFRDSIVGGELIGPGYRDGMNVAQVLEAACQSMRENGAACSVESHEYEPMTAT